MTNTADVQTTATVENYKLAAANGRHIRVATRVKYSDGRVVAFIEKMSKREALRQAAAELKRHPQHY
jgi:hypothetical protein